MQKNKIMVGGQMDRDTAEPSWCLRLVVAMKNTTEASPFILKGRTRGMKIKKRKEKKKLSLLLKI